MTFRDEMEGLLIFLLGLNRVGGAQLLDHRRVQAHAFLHFRGDDEALALELRHFRLRVALISDRQNFRRNLACIAAEYAGDGVPERGLAFLALAFRKHPNKSRNAGIIKEIVR